MAKTPKTPTPTTTTVQAAVAAIAPTLAAPLPMVRTALILPTPPAPVALILPAGVTSPTARMVVPALPVSTPATPTYWHAPLAAPSGASAAVPVPSKKGTGLTGRHAIALMCAIGHNQPVSAVMAFAASCKLLGVCPSVGTLGGTKGLLGQPFTAAGWHTLGNAIAPLPAPHAAWVAPGYAAHLLLQAAGPTSKAGKALAGALGVLGVTPVSTPAAAPVAATA